MSDVDYIKLSATARHIQETVLHRANDNGAKLSPDTVRKVMQAAIDLAFIAHQKDFGKASVPSGISSIQEPDDEPTDASIGDDWDYDPYYRPRSGITR